jgi:orotate phosphoribosyltransferase
VKKMTNELASRIKSCPQLKGEFTLRSGKVSDTYFDKYLFESDPELLVAICKEMAKLIPKTTDILAGLELGGIPVVPVLSQVTGLPCAFLRKEAKECDTCKC